MTRTISISAALLLATAIWPLVCFQRAARKTALRSTSGWAAVVFVWWSIAAGLGGLEPRPGEWLWLGLVRLVAAGLALAPLVAVLGARWPGERAWNLIVLTLLVVFTLPVLEQSLLGKHLERDRVGMDGPRFAFFGLVAVVGIVNYLPTRFGPAAALVAAGLSAQLAAVGPWTIDAAVVSNLSSLAAILIGASAWTAWLLRPRQTQPGIDGAWRQLRDNWGLVWSSRVRDRWNAAGAQYGWPVRLGWNGLERVSATSFGDDWVPGPDDLRAGERHLRSLLRRFAEPEWWLINPSCDADDL